MQTLLKKINKFNIKIDFIDEKLDIQAPKGTMTKELLDEIKLHKKELIEFITLHRKVERKVFIAKTPKKASYILSSSQRRLWILSQLDGGNTAYNMPSIFKLKGNLEISSLQNAFKSLIERHESLRTIFKETESGEVKQIILNFEETKFQLQYEDLSNEIIPKLTIEEIIQKEIEYSFDLSFDSLLRAKLVKTAPDSYVFICLMHHIISDGWSAEIMANELFILYDAYVNGNSNPLPLLQLQYKDYAAWQQDQLKSDTIEGHKSYWLRQFQDEIPILELPFYQTRPSIKTYNGKSIKKIYNEEILKDFNGLCKSQGSTLFMGLLSLIKVLLYKYSNHTDIIIGSPIAGREHADLHNQIGFYVNTLALRTQFEGTNSFKELLANVKEVTLGAYEHQIFPFDELVEVLPLKRDMSRNPLFDVMVRIHETNLSKNDTQKIAEVEISSYESENTDLTKFDFEFAFNEIDEKLGLVLIFNTDIYSEEFAEKILNHIDVLLDSIIANSDVSISLLNYLTESEKKQVLYEFNDTEMDYPKNKTVVDLFEEQLEIAPDNIAVVFEGTKLTYRELNEKSNQFASYLIENYAIQSDDFVGIKLERSEKLIVTILGVLKSGGAYVPIDPHYPQNRIDFIEKDSNSKVVIDEAEFNKFNSDREKYSLTNINLKIKNSSLVYLIYTSGSTGVPKGIMMEHLSMLNLITYHNKQFIDENVNKVLQFTSISFDVSFQEIFSTLLTGATLYPISEIVKKDSDELSAFIKRNNIDTVFLPTAYFKILMEVKAFYSLLNLNIIKNIIVAGEQLILSDDALNKISKCGINLHNHYGPAEAHVVTTIVVKDNYLTNNPPIGCPISNTQIYLLDEFLSPVGLGVKGKLYISGVGVSRGYLNNVELTSSKFIPNPFVSGSRMYDTGDLGFWLPDGNISFLGRRDHQVKIRGFRVELGEIETTVLQYSEDLKQVIVESKNSDQDKVLVVYYVSDSLIDKSNLRQFLQERLPDYMVPSFYVAIESLPLTPNGKIDRKSLPEIDGESLIRKEYTAPRNDLQAKLVEIWQEVLGVDRIGITDNFFEFGGHSLIVAQVINRVYKQLNQTVTFKTFFFNPTIEGLSLGLQAQAYTPILKAPVASCYPLTPSQGRLWILSQLEGGSLAYNMPAAVKFTGVIDVVKFEESFQRLIYCHEILRTYFKINEEGEIRQYIVAPDLVNFVITEKDFTSEQDQYAIDRYLKQTNNEPFDLEHAPLIRASLLKLKEEEYIFFLSVHHIIGDGWSLEILISEIVKVYNALTVGEEINLPELSIQYKDYAVWLNEAMQEEKHQMSEKYWLEQFSGELPVLDLPSFKPRPLVQTYNGASFSYSFSKSFLEKLKIFSQSEDVTLFMTLMAGINVLLHQYTGQNDIVLGTPIAGRDHPDLENQLGLYLNILGIRTRFNDKDSFIDLVNQEKCTLVEAYEHQNYPFDALVDKLNLKRDLSRSALFDVLVVLQNQNQLNSLSRENLNNLEVSRYDLDSNISKFDVSFIFIEIEEKLDLVIEYNTDIYDSCLIERMFSHLENILVESLTHPEIPIADIDYLTVEEKQCLLVEFNDTEADYARDKTIIDLFEDQVERTPDNIGLVFEDEELSYKNLNERSNQLASYLRSVYDIQANDLVGIKLNRSGEMIITLLGILKSGAAYVPIDPNYPQERIAYIEKNSESKIVIDEKEFSKFKKVQERYSKSNIIKINQSTDLAYVIYTSGTTGNPKGVMIEHRSVVNFLKGMNDSISLNGNDHLLAITSISFDISVLELFWTLSQGITISLKRDNTLLNNFNSLLEDSHETLNFSLFYFSSQDDSADNKYQFLKESATYADKNGFSGIWLPERHFHEFGGIFPNPSVLGAALSTITENIEIRSGSVVLPLHDVIRVAEEWSVVDNLSNGRVALSIASGWHADDFVLKPENYLDRQKIMYNQIDELKTLWQGGAIMRKNGLNQEISVKIYPKPINPNLDIYVTAGGNAETFKSAGKIGANILTHLLGQDIKELGEKIKIYKQALTENGFSIDNAKISLMLHTYIGVDLKEVRDKAKEPFKSYLKSSVGLIQNLAKDFDKDITNISEDDLDYVLELAFERYWQTSALLGTHESCKKILSQIYAIGVTEIACLVDFGIDDNEVLNGLEHLTELKNYYKKDAKQDAKQGQSNSHPITSLQITPSYLEVLLDDINSIQFIKSLDNIIVGGEKFSSVLLSKIMNLTSKANIYNMYGPTETTIWSTFQKIREDKTLSIGKPIQNTEVYILDHNNKICPIGVKGELCIAGDGLARGYYNEEKLTRDKFIEIEFSATLHKRVYKTGDLARWMPDGNLEHLGRLDNQVKVNGFRIELGEIESLLLKDDHVDQAVVVAVENNKGYKSLAAYFISKKDISPKTLKKYLEQKLPYYMVPNNFVQLEEFPLTPNGKIDRKSLPDISGEDLGTEYIPPSNEIENKLVKIWQDILGIEKIGITDDFLNLGGNSLLLIKMLNSINREFQTNISLAEGFNLHNIFSISKHIDFIAEESKTAKWLQEGNLREGSEEFEEVLI